MMRQYHVYTLNDRILRHDTMGNYILLNYGIAFDWRTNFAVCDLPSVWDCGIRRIVVPLQRDI